MEEPIEDEDELKEDYSSTMGDDQADAVKVWVKAEPESGNGDNGKKEKHFSDGEFETPHVKSDPKRSDATFKDYKTEVIKTEVKSDDNEDMTGDKYSQDPTEVSAGPIQNCTIKDRGSVVSNQAVDDECPSKTKKSMQHACKYCDKMFSRLSRLDRHMSIHSNAKDFQCSLCDKCFARKDYLAVHMVVHSGENKYVCNICSKGFNRSGTLLFHLRTHSGEKPYVCTTCNRRFSRSSHLKNHILIHDQARRFPCEHCGEQFTERGSLKRHMSIHTGQKIFQCQTCSKAFSVRHSLKQHLLSHTGEKEFECKFCSKKVASQSALNRHIRVNCKSKCSGT